MKKLAVLFILALILVFLLSAIAHAKSSCETAEAALISDMSAKRVIGKNSVSITDIRSNKVRYIENENAATRVTLVNNTDKECTGTLIAVMHLDLDTKREVARTAFIIPPGVQKDWEFSYNVGCETYGRGMEVRFIDNDGNLINRRRL